MAIRIQLRRDTAANWVSNNPTLREGEIGIETDTLKFKIGNGSSTWTSITNYANVTPSGLTNSLSDYILVADQGNPGGPAELDANGDLIIPENAIILWNDAAYDYTTTLAATQPTANRTITFPNSTGTVALTSDLTPYAPLSGATFTGNIQVPTAITFEGATADSYETTVQATDPTADRTITIPDITGTIVTTGDTGTVTNTMLAGSIANNKLANSSVTINGYEIALGASASYGTDNIGEGTTNLYFTNERAQDAVAQALANGTHTNITVSYSDNDNAISLTGAQTYNDEMARDAIGAALTGGSGITVTPNDNADTITVAVDSSIATKTYADNAVSTGISNLIASAPSALDTLNELAAALGNDANFSTTVTNALAGKQDKVTGVSDTEISYLDGVTSAIQTQLNAKASSTDLSNHENDTTNIHGIADTSALATKTYADGKASDAQSAAASALASHEADTTSIHGISDTSKLVTTDDSGTVTSTMIANGTIVNADINASAAIDWTKLAVSSTVSATELGYVDGVTSAIQTQLDSKLASATAASTYAPIASPTFTGTVTVPTLNVNETSYLNGNVNLGDAINDSTIIKICSCSRASIKKRGYGSAFAFIQ